jgi:hypothetical protein
VFGWRGNLSLLGEWIGIVAKPALNINRSASPLFGQLLDPEKNRNQSFEAVVTRIFPHTDAFMVSIVAGLAMAVVMLLVARRCRDQRWLLSAVICWMLLVSPVSENHYFALLLPPLTVLVAARRFAASRAVLAFFVATHILWHCFSRVQVWGGICWGTVALWGALMFLAWRGEEVRDAET